MLTKRSVNKRAGRAAAGAARRRRPRRPADSRAVVFAAAAREFAARGFAGASVDRIARAARLNKAMIYYHFRNKAELYRAVLRDMLQAVGARAREVAAAPIPPDDKIRTFVASLAAEADRRPHFPPIWFREVAEGGTHLDAALLVDMMSVVGAVGAIVEEGARQGTYQRVSPLLVHAGIVAPLLLFYATEPLRQRLARAGMPSAALDREEVVAHLQQVTLGLLHGRM
jgi:TetR/AcrR family transcriptional regulator